MNNKANNISNKNVRFSGVMVTEHVQFDIKAYHSTQTICVFDTHQWHEEHRCECLSV